MEFSNSKNQTSVPHMKLLDGTFHLPSLSIRLHQTFWFDEHRVFCNTDHNLLSRVGQVLSISGWRETQAVTCQSNHQIQYRQNISITSPLSHCRSHLRNWTNISITPPLSCSRYTAGTEQSSPRRYLPSLPFDFDLHPRTHVPMTDTRRSTTLCRARGRQVFKQYSQDQKIPSQFELHRPMRSSGAVFWVF